MNPAHLSITFGQAASSAPEATISGGARRILSALAQTPPAVNTTGVDSYTDRTALRESARRQANKAQREEITQGLKEIASDSSQKGKEALITILSAARSGASRLGSWLMRRGSNALDGIDGLEKTITSQTAALGNNLRDFTNQAVEEQEAQTGEKVASSSRTGVAAKKAGRNLLGFLADMGNSVRGSFGRSVNTSSARSAGGDINLAQAQSFLEQAQTFNSRSRQQQAYKKAVSFGNKVLQKPRNGNSDKIAALNVMIRAYEALGHSDYAKTCKDHLAALTENKSTAV